MKIVLTGANSYLGARLYVDISKYHDVIGTYSSNQLSSQFIHLDITQSQEITSVMNEYKPDVIIHAANNANARWCESHPQEAKLINQESTSSLVQAANTIGAEMIYISSFSAINPTNIYGQTKYESEQIVKTIQRGYLIFQPSLIIGYSPNTTNDRPFNRILKHIGTNIPAAYDTSWKFQPTHIGHISSVILQCLSQSIQNETIAIACPEVKTRYDIAKDILAPFSIPVEPIDNHDESPVILDDQSTLRRLSLPVIQYEQSITCIVDEIRNRDHFILQ